MLLEYIQDPENERKITSLLGLGIDFIIHGHERAGKKTVLNYCLQQCGKKYDTVAITNLEKMTECDTLAMFNQDMTILHICGFENVENANVLKDFFKFVKRKSRFIQIVMCCQTQPRDCNKLFHFVRFQNNNNSESSLRKFYALFNMPYTDPVKMQCISILKGLANYKANDIRNLSMNLTKTNFPFKDFYKFIVSCTHNHQLIEKAATCEHLSNVGNKKPYYFEHFLFFIKDGNLSRFIKIRDS